MKMADALATAAENGWQDQSQWTPSPIAEQVSRVTSGLLSTVTVLVDGTVQWSVMRQDRTERGQRGTARDIDHAFAACENATAAITGTLF